ncbi:MAG: hypothetical protein ACLTSX_03005 [Collinsella sp.]
MKEAIKGVHAKEVGAFFVLPLRCAVLCSAWLPLSAFAAGEVVETQNVDITSRSQGTRTCRPACRLVKFSADKAADALRR